MVTKKRRLGRSYGSPRAIADSADSISENAAFSMLDRTVTKRSSCR